MKRTSTLVGLVSLLAMSACGSSYAEPSRGPVAAGSYGSYTDSDRAAQPVADWSEQAPATSSPYRVELLYGDANQLPTFYTRGGAYVLGAKGERYRIRIANPTSRRVEAVVSVDGLDAIDGRPASFDDKRGYVIAPYGEVIVDGFRTSTDQVATFRFSSVRDSYAGRTGQARNVGVIGVAFFPERERPVAVMPRPQPYPSPYYDDRERGRAADEAAPRKSAPYGGSDGASRAPSAPPRSAAAPSAASGAAESKGDAVGGYAGPRPEARRGLGTEFGEQRFSSVGYTSFQRENALYPSNVVEVRYNDRQGLLALGIPVDALMNRTDDLSLRESADPFPRSRYAVPPPR